MHYQNERVTGCRISDAWTYRGLKTVVMENEHLRVVVLADKGADIYQLVHKPSDVDFMWRSPWGVRDPSKYVPTTGAGASLWLDFYEGGWQSVLPAGGFSTNYKGGDIGLHADVSIMPWDAVVTEDTPQRISARFWVRSARTPFYAERTLTLQQGKAVLEVSQTIVNESADTEPCVWLEHVALGAPLLSGDSVLDLPECSVESQEKYWHDKNRLKEGAKGRWPYIQGKDGKRIDMRKIPPPSAKLMDMAYFTQMAEGWYALTNQKLGVGFALQFPKETFRYLWFWQVFGGGNGYPWFGRTYNVGLEPCTSLPNTGIQAAVENKTALMVQPGQRVTATLKAIAFQSTRGVERVNPDGTVVVRK